MAPPKKPVRTKAPKKPAGEKAPTKPGEREATVPIPGGKQAPRCQATSKGSGGQCARPARKGHRVCGAHGAGYAKREKNGSRKSPKTAPITHAMTAQPETVEEWVGLNKDLNRRMEHYLRDRVALRNLDQLLARLWAVADIVGETRPDISWSLEGGASPPPLLDVLKGLASTLEKVARIEWKIQQSGLPTLTIRQAQRLVRGVVELLHDVVPADGIDAALRRLERIASGVVGEHDPTSDGAQPAPTVGAA